MIEAHQNCFFFRWISLYGNAIRNKSVKLVKSDFESKFPPSKENAILFKQMIS